MTEPGKVPPELETLNAILLEIRAALEPQHLTAETCAEIRRRIHGLVMDAWDRGGRSGLLDGAEGHFHVAGGCCTDHDFWRRAGNLYEARLCLVAACDAIKDCFEKSRLRLLSPAANTDMQHRGMPPADESESTWSEPGSGLAASWDHAFGGNGS